MLNFRLFYFFGKNRFVPKRTFLNFQKNSKDFSSFVARAEKFFIYLDKKIESKHQSGVGDLGFLGIFGAPPRPLAPNHYPRQIYRHLLINPESNLSLHSPTASHIKQLYLFDAKWQSTGSSTLFIR